MSVDPLEPPATYLITFRTYGSWLHGDARGSVHRRRNEPGQARIPAAPALEQWERAQMRDPGVILNLAQRGSCTDAIRGIAARRGWNLLALNVRSNHVHAVVEASVDADLVMNDFKAFATRALRKSALVEGEVKVWSRGGSVRRLDTSDAVERACRYVVEEQGEALGVFLPER